MPENRNRVDDVTDKDWLFDFLLSVFKSPQWDVAVMGFIDENCAVFDGDEENKLSYTSLHHQFKDLVESLCSSSLAEVGVAVEDFVDALDSSRLSQDVSTVVYEQLVALDDFVTFKKLMVKRNVELELEAVRVLQVQGVPIQNSDEGGAASSEEGKEYCDGETRKQEKSAESNGSKTSSSGARRERNKLDRELQRAMEANLRELELMHKTEEVEQAELEQAIAMSLALETKRVELEAQQESATGYSNDSNGSGGAKRINGDVHSGGGKDFGATGSEVDCKGSAGDRTEGSRSRRKEIDARAAADNLAEAKCDFSERNERKRSSFDSRKNADSKALPPLSMTRGENRAPFRGGGGEVGTCLRDPDVVSAERKREARLASVKSQRLLEERRRAQEVLKSQSDVSKEKIAQRERHLKELRDNIVSVKRAKREDEALKAKRAAPPRPSVIASASPAPTRGLSGGKLKHGITRASGGDDKSGEDTTTLVVNGEEVEKDFAEEQRRSMRVALARHMKRELIESEQERLSKVQAEQLADLNGKLRLVEKLRDENSDREAEIARVLRQQQDQRARNVATSAVSVQENDEDFTFDEGG